MSDSPDKAQSSETGLADPFRGYKEAYKTLRTLQLPISEAVREDYIRNVERSKSGRYIAFRLLSLRAIGELQTRLTPFLPQLEQILFKDCTPLELRQCDSIDDVTRAVAARFTDIHNKSDLKQFAAAGYHLPILFGLIRVWDQPAKFQAALDALATTLDRITKPKRAQKLVPSNNLEIVARTIIARVPEKPLVGKAVPELLKIAQALFHQSEETARDYLILQSELAQAVGEGESLQSELNEQREAVKNLETKLAAAKANLNRLEADLKKEREHFETLKGHGEAERKAAVQDAVARVQSEVSRRIENIRLFADREIPNRQGILNLANEIQRVFADRAGEKS
ncbi:MAG TPA: hypothetical protein VIW07_12890 [Candidatus Udaeobacter sp.]|jgi:hypothetical protein